MTPTDQQQQNLVKKQQRWQRLLRIWRHRAYRRRALIACILIVPVVAILITFGIIYHHYAGVIDAQLRGGPFKDSMNIYGSEFVLNQGDSLTPEEIQAELRLAGYTDSGSASPRTYRMSAGAIDINSAAGGSGAAHVIFAKNAISRIMVNGRPENSFTTGFPLMANLSASRDKRQMVTFNEIPKVLVDAVVSAEDKHYFTHGGVDLPRVAKAAWVDFRNGRKAQGASTLTMQLVRGLWLAPEKRWKRKIAESLMTVHLERTWSKEKIFETYANQVYMGREASYSIHGFAEGARVYFGKELNALTLPEAALLAGMVQRPSYFNPVRNPERTKGRRDLVLRLMRENRMISENDYRDAIATPVNLTPHSDRNDAFGTSYFLDQVTDELQDDNAPDDAHDVYTTIDLSLQKAAMDSIAAGMREVDAVLAKNKKNAGRRAEASLIAIDPHTGEIRAMVGGRNYETSQLNRVLSRRPPGSVFKPFVYAAALNTGIEGGKTVLTTASTVDDSPTVFRAGNQTYQPANFHNEEFGILTLRQALAHSDNVAAVKVGQEIGFDSVVAMARRAGLNDDIKATPSVALGAYDVTPLEMAGAYTVFANGGIWVKPQMVASVRDAAGEVIRTAQSESHQALDPRVAYLMTSMLQDVMRYGTAAGARSRGFLQPAAGKTGTSHDGWFSGYTSQLLCIVWVGYDDYTELNLEGAKSALPIWTEFMKRASKLGAYRNAKEFSAPGGLTSAKICTDSGKLAGDLCENTRNDQFINGTAPQDTCDQHTGQFALAPPDPALPGSPVTPNVSMPQSGPRYTPARVPSGSAHPASGLGAEGNAAPE